MKSLYLQSATLIALCALALTAQAGGHEGNGGKVVVCKNSTKQIQSVELLDYYEAGVRGISIKLGAPNLSVQQKLEIMLDRIAAHDVDRAARYRKWIGEFFSPKYTKYLADTVLEDTRDSFENSFPAGCAPEQLIIQQPPRFPEDRLWTVSQDLWDKMDNDNRAGAIVHEVMFREALHQTDRTATDSRRVRYFNSYVAGDRLASMTEQQYIDFIRDEVQLDIASAQGVEFHIWWSCKDDCPTSSAPFQFYKSSNGQIIKNVLTTTATPVDLGGNVYIPGNFGAHFYPTGEVQAIDEIQNAEGIVVASGQSLQIGGPSGVENTGMPNYASVDFYPNGFIHGVPIKEQTFKWRGQNLDIVESVVLDQAQNLRETVLGQPATVTVNGRQLDLPKGGILKFDSDGNIVGANTTTPQSFNGSYYRLAINKPPFGYDFEIFPDGGLKSLSGVGIQGQLRVDGSWHNLVANDNLDLWRTPTFYHNGRPRQVQLEDDIDFQIQGKTLTATAGGEIIFSNSGQILQAKVARGGFFSSDRDWFALKVGSQNVRFDRDCGDDYGYCQLSLYADGHVKGGYTYHDQTLTSANGKTVDVPGGSVVGFDENGQLVSVNGYHGYGPGQD